MKIKKQQIDMLYHVEFYNNQVVEKSSLEREANYKQVNGNDLAMDDIWEFLENNPNGIVKISRVK